VPNTQRPGAGDAEPKLEELRIQEPRSSSQSLQSKQGSSIIVAPFVRINRGAAGFEAFSADEKSLGLFPTQREAAAAIMRGAS
jgi:hypothetical protein